MDVSTVNGFQVSAAVGPDLDAEAGTTINDTLPDRVILPEPDPDNITVLTHELPNDPILPWHHFDSPWLAEGEEGAGETAAATETEVGDRPVSPTPPPPPAENDPAAATTPLVTTELSMPALDPAIAPPPDTLPDSLG